MPTVSELKTELDECKKLLEEFSDRYTRLSNEAAIAERQMMARDMLYTDALDKYNEALEVEKLIAKLMPKEMKKSFKEGEIAMNSTQLRELVTQALKAKNENRELPS